MINILQSTDIDEVSGGCYCRCLIEAGTSLGRVQDIRPGSATYGALSNSEVINCAVVCFGEVADMFMCEHECSIAFGAFGRAFTCN